MEIRRHFLMLFIFSLLQGVTFALSQHTSGKDFSVSIPWTEVGFFAVLLLDFVAVIVLIVVLKYRKNHNNGLTYRKALTREKEVKTPIYKGPAVHHEFKMDKIFHEYNALSQIEETDQHSKSTNASTESLYDSVRGANLFSQS